jgi:AcrR family transcriptional regulator
MPVEIKFNGNEHLYLKNPEQSDLGRRILQQGASILLELGYEEFTFKKMALQIGTTEATVYRYFVNKHRFLLYLLSSYWNIMQFIIITEIQHISDPREKINRIIELLLHLDTKIDIQSLVPMPVLIQIAKNESTKAYRIKSVDDLNTYKLYSPYKELCQSISLVFLELNDYPYPRNLASTLLEMSLHLPFFSAHLPSLTDVQEGIPNLHEKYLKDLVFKSLS